LDNYRGITLSSNVYKVFSKVIEEKIVSYLEATMFWANHRELLEKIGDSRTMSLLYRVFCHKR
jgi:hypothetical protein